MFESATLAQAIALTWDALPALVGEDWEEFEARLLLHLRDLEAARGDDRALRIRILAEFEKYPAARERLVKAMAGLGPVRLKGQPAAAAPRHKRYVEVPIYYATDRAATGAVEPASFYGSERGELSFGAARVSIPDDHRMGALEKPRWWKLQFREDPAAHVVLLAVDPLERAVFLERVRAGLEGSKSPDALVFLHGYNVTFEDAARRTAQIAYDLNFPGVPILYSWPSEGDAHKYTVDENNVTWTRPHFREFLRTTLADLGAGTVHVLAHSMGNRALVEAMAAFDPAALPAGAARLRQIIFAAPDIDAETFEDLAAAFHGRAERFTLYASSNDHALKASRLVHKYPRAGESGASLRVVPGVDTVDASDIDTSLMGHSYYGDNRSVLSDIFELLRSGNAPDMRFGLAGADLAGSRYWVFRK